MPERKCEWCGVVARGKVKTLFRETDRGVERLCVKCSAKQDEININRQRQYAHTKR